MTRNAVAAGFTIILTDEKYEETESIGYARRTMYPRSVLVLTSTLATPLARGGTVRNRRTSVVRSGKLILDRIPHLARQGPNLNPRYPRVFANRQLHLFSNPNRRESLLDRDLRLLALRPLLRRAFSGMEDQMEQAVATSWKKRGCHLAFLALHGLHHQLRGDLRRTILSVSMLFITLYPSVTIRD